MLGYSDDDDMQRRRGNRRETRHIPEQLLHPCTLLVKEGGTTIHDLAFFLFFFPSSFFCSPLSFRWKREIGAEKERERERERRYTLNDANAITASLRDSAWFALGRMR